MQVSCKVYDPTIASVNPDGYWYRIASNPWDNNYYAPANTFLNGDPPNGPYTHNTDFAVPDCAGAASGGTGTASVTLAQGPAAPYGYRYAVTVSGFPANTAVSISCRDSVDPNGFYTFNLATNSSGSGSVSNDCYSGDGPDHWVVANGQISSNHVQWGSGGSSGTPPPSSPTPPSTGGAGNQTPGPGDLPAGWASGGSPSDPQKQVNADTECASNSVLLFSVRGSGADYGAPDTGNALGVNRIGGWTVGAGIQLIHDGWNVRDLQAIYPAPSVPSFTELGAALVAGGPVAAALVLKDYRDVATQWWQSVMSELVAAYNRCPTRPILLAGYSQGSILLRYIVPNLSRAILDRIVSIDLIADPTEQGAVDSSLEHPPNLDGLLTGEGVDTFAGIVLNAAIGRSFRQASYPSAVAGHTSQYCMEDDLVCNVGSASLSPTSIPNEGAVHASYAFEAIGIDSARRLGQA